MEQALEAFKLSNISFGEQSGTEYGSTTRVSSVLCLYIAFVTFTFINHTFKLYLCGIHFSYSGTGEQCPLIEHDYSGVRIIMLLNVLNVYSKQQRNREILQTSYISPYMDYLLHAACVTLTSWGIYN